MPIALISSAQAMPAEPGPVHDQPGVAQGPAGEVDRVDQAGRGDDRGAVLVVVEHRHVDQLPEALLDHEALGRLDVLEVDPAEAARQQPHAVDERVDVARVDLQVDRVDVGEPLEEDRLALHHRLGGQGAQVAQPQHGRAVRDHGHQVALGV
jgi:hypothetical protein